MHRSEALDKIHRFFFVAGHGTGCLKDEDLRYDAERFLDFLEKEIGMLPPENYKPISNFIGPIYEWEPEEEK